MTVENLSTVCGFHHGLATRDEFGDALVDEIAARRRSRARRGHGGAGASA